MRSRRRGTLGASINMCRVLAIWTALLFLLTSTSTAQAGLIVVNSDAWTLSQTGFDAAPLSTTNFVLNMANAFSPNGAGNFLGFSYDPSLTGVCCLGGFGAAGTSLRDTFVSAGDTWTISTAVPFTLQSLLSYNGVFLGGPTYSSSAPGCGLSASAPTCGYPDNQVLIDYVKAGGNVY